MDNINQIKQFLNAIKFKLKDGENASIYEKKYDKCNNYAITVELNETDYKKSKINYGDSIKCGRRTTQYLNKKDTILDYKSETFVVLECVNRLLDKGYSPNSIILEKDYPSGRKESGQYLDILIEKEGSSYYMIECKTYGEKYEEELKNLLNNGGQLFTYYTNDRGVKGLCLYSSVLMDGEIKKEYKIIDSSEFEGSDKRAIFNKWNKQFETSGIFEDLYGSTSTGITKLKRIDRNNKLYNGFARILRKYAVSDSTNAYNKLFNLFLCKIVDEDNMFANNDYQIQFQWKKEETDYDVLDKLSNLYKQGIEDYLGIKVTDYSKETFIDKLAQYVINDKNLFEELKKEFNEIRFIKNNEFAFIEVFNKDTFNQNIQILKEVIKLFQGVQIKYTDKQQFLGDFFERLLNIGIKQTEGQFFTPIPIANFIVNSIPFEKIVDKKIKSGDKNFLPYMIDYACGAGHFLTEYMHRIEPILMSKNREKDFVNKQQLDNFDSWNGGAYKWAKEFVYGIEKDYRLTKTSKIACFLNGDGEAKVITGNGLDRFDSPDFKGILHQDNIGEYRKNNEMFDVLIANPPYSVQNFRDTLKTADGEPFGETCFELYNELGENSDDIECLFVERAKQLLKENGIAAIILQDALLDVSSPDIRIKTRKFIFENFEIKAIIELGKGAFMATETNTVVLFLKKRKNERKKEIQNLIKRFIENLQDFNFNEKSQIIQQYLNDTHDDLKYEDYITLFKNAPNENFKNSELADDYYTNYIEQHKNTKLTKDNIDYSNLINIEKEKLQIYLLNENVETIIASTGSTKDERAKFLGYKFSKRKGTEGLKELSNSLIEELDTYSNRNAIISKLYNPSKIMDKTKLSYYIYSHLNNTNKIDLHEANNFLDNRIKKCNLNEIIEYPNLNAEPIINIKQKNMIIESKYDKDKLRNVIEIKYGTRIKKDENKEKTYPVYGGGGESFRTDEFNREDELVISRFGMSKQCVRFVSGKFFLNDSGFTIKSKSQDLLQEYLNILLIHNQDIIYACGKGSQQKNINIPIFKKIEIPIPPKTIQKKIINEFQELKNKGFKPEEFADLPIKEQLILDKYLK